MILCQITSKERNDKYSLKLEKNDIINGSLNLTSNIRPNKLFTAEKSIINYKIGSLNNNMMKIVESSIIELFSK